eukprot:jgi/Botrbrau1/7343/Bobra.247_3s0036.1
MTRHIETKYLEQDALNYSPNSDVLRAATNKNKSRKKHVNKSLEISFDPAALRDYVTGFHKRKVQRRKEAQRIAAEKARQKRIEERAKRREQLRLELDLDRYEAPTESDAEATNEEKKVQVYNNDAFTTTVTLAPISLHPDSGTDEDEDKGDLEPQEQKSSDICAKSLERKSTKKSSREGMIKRKALKKQGTKKGHHQKGRKR